MLTKDTLKIIKERRSIRSYKTELQIPDGFKPVASIALGYKNVYW